MSYPSDWRQHNFLDDTRNEIPPPTTTTAAAAMTSRNTNPALDHGRGARPIRRRSRASRRTPTTLLNTDTTNFRAMVQQFTGIPTAAASASAYTATPHLNIPSGTLDFTQRYAGHVVPSNLYPGSGGAHAQYPNQMQQQHMFMAGDIDMHGGGGGGGDVTPHAPPGSSSTNENRGHDNYMF